MNVTETEFEQRLHLGLHYDNLEFLVAECRGLATRSSELGVGYYVIGGILGELMDEMDQQAVPSASFLSAQAFLTPLIATSLQALGSGSKEASWNALNVLIREWNSRSSTVSSF